MIENITKDNNLQITISKEDCKSKCKVFGCNKNARSLGYCNAHYKLYHRTGNIEYSRGNTNGICSVEGCTNAIKAKRLCAKHLQRLYRTNSTDLNEHKGNNIIKIKDNHAILFVGEQQFIIDLDDVDRVSKYTWRVSRNKNYICTHIRPYGNIMLHRFIVNEYKSNNRKIVVDHINRNTYDNRKCNLRICSISINSLNKKAKGYYKTRSGNYQVQICTNGKRINIGTYKTEIEAINAYNNYKDNYINNYENFRTEN